MHRRTTRLLLLLLCWAWLGPLPTVRAFNCAANDSQQCIPEQWQSRYIPSFGVYVVQRGDWLSSLAQDFQIDLGMLTRANRLSDPSHIEVGQQLIIPGRSGRLIQRVMPSSPRGRGSVVERQVRAARQAGPQSPFYRRTWVTYYGRPSIPIMGILGEYEIDELVPLLQAQAEAYDQINGAELDVMPAFHLVYGMATSHAGKDQDHLDFLKDEVVQAYIDRAQQEGWAVILDCQIGALSPQEALAFGLPWLKYDNVHLALDPEFAMTHADQTRPGLPIGFVTAAQINAAQQAMADYMQEHDIAGSRMLMVHQFMTTMIQNKEDLQAATGVALTITADGFGSPWPKISKYNAFTSNEEWFTGFKLFYKWDFPLLTEREVLGIDHHAGTAFIQLSPNVVIYQ